MFGVLQPAGLFRRRRHVESLIEPQCRQIHLSVHVPVFEVESVSKRFGCKIHLPHPRRGDTQVHQNPRRRTARRRPAEQGPGLCSPP